MERAVRNLLPLLLLAALACSKPGAVAAKARPAPLVAAAKVSVRDVEVAVRAPVDLRPLLQAEVSSKTIGYLDAVLVDRGDRVKRGQLLAVVRPSDLPDQLAAARGSALQAAAAAELARANRERAQALAPSGRISKQELQQTESAVASAEAAEASARAQVGALAVRLGETRITSPLDGVISARRLDPGVLVGPTAGTGSIVTIDQIDVLRLFVTVNENDVLRLRLGQPTKVELDSVPGRVFLGKVMRLAPSLDPATRTLDAEVHLPNPSGELRAGMYGRASIVTGVHPAAVTVPSPAVQFTSGRSFVFALQGDKVQRREIKLGVDGEEWLEVVQGLQPEEEIVVAGLEGLSDGATVRASRGVDPYGGPPPSAPNEGRPVLKTSQQ
jgi:RND family efflux transporter MFP subunit